MKLRLFLAVSKRPVEMRNKRLLLAFHGKDGVNGPVFLGNKRVDFVFPVRNHTKRHRLYAPRGKASLDLCPEERRNLITDHAVQNSSCLLRVNQIHVNAPRMPEGFGDSALCDLVEGHTADVLVRKVQRCHQMPGNRLSLAVRVRREINFICLFNPFPKVCEKFSLSADRYIFRLKIMFDVNAHLALGQISDMPLAGSHIVSGTEKFSDRLYLCR